MNAFLQTAPTLLEVIYPGREPMLHSNFTLGAFIPVKRETKLHYIVEEVFDRPDGSQYICDRKVNKQTGQETGRKAPWCVEFQPVNPVKAEEILAEHEAEVEALAKELGEALLPAPADEPPAAVLKAILEEGVVWNEAEMKHALAKPGGYAGMLEDLALTLLGKLEEVAAERAVTAALYTHGSEHGYEFESDKSYIEYVNTALDNAKGEVTAGQEWCEKKTAELKDTAELMADIKEWVRIQDRNEALGLPLAPMFELSQMVSRLPDGLNLEEV